MSDESVQHYVDAFRDLLPPRGAPWLDDLRRAGLSRFESVGFPSRRNEGWKYTDVRPITKRRFRTSATPDNGTHRAAVDSVSIEDPEIHRLVFVNGRFSEALSRLSPSSGVRLASMRQLLAENASELEPWMTAYSHRELGSFAALNTAFLIDGAYIRLDDEAVVEHPIHLLFLSVPETEPVVTHPHVLLVAGAASKATVVEQYLGVGDAANFTNAVSMLTLAPGADIQHYKVQEETTRSFHVGCLHVQQQAQSSFHSHNLDLGGSLVRNDLQADLADRGAEVRLNGLYLATGRQHVDNHTRIDHSSPETRSHEIYKGIMSGHARAVFNGKVVVHKQAQKIDAHQQNHNLLLSEGAEVNTKPELEIYADDVKCSHGATVGQLDKHALFYLRSRGLDEEVARGLLTFAFAEDVVLHLGLPQLRSRIERAVIGFLPRGELIEEFV